MGAAWIWDWIVRSGHSVIEIQGGDYRVVIGTLEYMEQCPSLARSPIAIDVQGMDEYDGVSIVVFDLCRTVGADLVHYQGL
jgi:hypothetical protein